MKKIMLALFLLWLFPQITLAEDFTLELKKLEVTLPPKKGLHVQMPLQEIPKDAKELLSTELLVRPDSKFHSKLQIGIRSVSLSGVVKITGEHARVDVTLQEVIPGPTTEGDKNPPSRSVQKQNLKITVPIGSKIVMGSFKKSDRNSIVYLISLTRMTNEKSE